LIHCGFVPFIDNSKGYGIKRQDSLSRNPKCTGICPQTLGTVDQFASQQTLREKKKFDLIIQPSSIPYAEEIKSVQSV
jgi:hypothetical protein